MGISQPTIEVADISVFTIPTDAPEADGTFKWDSTTLVVTELKSGEIKGLGYTYGNRAISIVAKTLAERCLIGQALFDIPALHSSMRREIRNDGGQGITAMAISALDIAIWDLKARTLGISTSGLVGSAQPAIPVYGSGGFTSYSNDQLVKQLSGWARDGFRKVKMKIGSDPSSDPDRVKTARQAIGDQVELFVDANGAYGVKQAIALSRRFSDFSVGWFEEPVSSDNLAGLRDIRHASPSPMEIAAGEYGYDSFYFRRMLEHHAVDVLQLDATRCMGFTGFLNAASIAASFNIPLSAHCAPTLHMHVACSIPGFRHIEYFHDHARIEQMFFDGFIPASNGELRPDRSRPGLGILLKREDVKRFAA